MAFKTNKAKTTAPMANARAVFDMTGNEAKVERVRQISDTCIVFTLKCKGFSFYDLKVCERKSDGEPFISVPADKGADGRYYNRYGLYLSESDQKEVISKVFEILNADEKPPFTK